MVFFKDIIKMKEQEDKNVLQDIVGSIITIAMVGAVICGALECFGIKTGIIGGILCAIPLLFLVIFILAQIIHEFIK